MNSNRRSSAAAPGWKATGRTGVVAAGGAGAVAAGVAILEKGGNAADAAVATILALAVTDYGYFCFGAEVPFLFYDARMKDVKVLSGVGPAPLSPEAIEWYYRRGIPGKGGMKAAPVPAAPSVCFAALERFGTMHFADVAAPVLSILDRHEKTWHADLARTIRKLTETEQATGGSRVEKLRAARDRFYRGDIAGDLEAWYIEQGGFLRKSDLAAFVTHLEEPVTVNYRGYTICKCGPWTQGPYLCQTLRLLERFSLKKMGHLSADHIHVCVEALKLGFADRDAYYGDPLFAGVPLRELLSDEYTDLRWPLIDLKRASKEIRPGDPLRRKALKGPGVLSPGTGGTTTCCIADRWGNVVAATPSGNPPYIDPPGGTTGVAHGNRLRSLNTTRGHPNRIEAGKRPRITLTPTLVLRDGRAVLAVSVAGGDLQDQTTLNLLLDHIEFDMLPEDAVRAPRFSTGHPENSFHPDPDRRATFGTPGSLQVSQEIPPAVLRDLEARGHVVKTTDRPIGYPVMVFIDGRTGLQHAAGDPCAKRHAAAARPR